MNICISAGHGGRDPGAVNSRLNLKEHVHAYAIAWELRERLESAGHSVEFIDCFDPLADKISSVNALHALKPVDLAIEIHFNSAENRTAHGTEVLYYSVRTKARAARISEELSKALNTVNRGAVKRDNLGWLKRTDPPALIIETLFISNDAEARKIYAEDFYSRVAEAITEGLKS